jgi:PilZ domain
MKSSAQTKEKRRSPRRVALMPAVIFYPNQNEHVDCTVRDLSQDGALLELPLAKELPLVFWLRLEGETALRFCTVAWHSENYLGVEFSEQITERRRNERWGEPFAVSVKPHTPA